MVALQPTESELNQSNLSLPNQTKMHQNRNHLPNLLTTKNRRKQYKQPPALQN